MVEENKLVPQGAASTAMTVPDFMRGEDVDETHYDPNELRIPRLAIAQAMSPQMTPNDPQYMGDALRLYDLFNDLSQDVYGKGPLHFVPVLRVATYIQFGPDGKSILDRDIPYDDPRTEWTKDEQSGLSVRPLATKFVNYLSLVLLADNPMPVPIAISMRLSNKLAKLASDRLTSMVEENKRKYRIPTYGGVYAVTVKPGTLPKGTFGVFDFRFAGAVQDQGLFGLAKRLHGEYQGKTIIVEAEAPVVDGGEDGGDASFDPTQMER